NTLHKSRSGCILGYAYWASQETSGNHGRGPRQIENDRASTEVGAGPGDARPDRAQLWAGDEQLRGGAEVAHHRSNRRKVAGTVSTVGAGRLAGWAAGRRTAQDHRSAN